MPLKCLHHQNPIFAFDYDEAGWDQLKASHRAEPCLTMACCGAKAILKVSKLGTRFFAHHAIGYCSSATETEEHLLAKTLVCQAARAAGWSADTEVRGQTPAGEEWIADVLATKGHAKVAIEIQWSRQGTAESQRRQRRYAESGVRGLWLLRHPDLLVERDTPTFLLEVRADESTAVVRLPSSRHELRWLTQRNKGEGLHWNQTIPLEAFISGALSGALRFAPAIGQSLPVSLCATEIRCWRCQQATSTVQGLTVEISQRFAGHPDLHINLDELDNGDEPAPWVASVFPIALLKQHGIGVIKPRYSRTANERYLSNGCQHCDALQGRFFEHEEGRDAEDVCQYEVILTRELVEQLARHGNDEFMRWWFDAR